MHVQILCVIYVVCCEMELVKSVDKLQFWKRDLKYDSRQLRRAMENSRKINKHSDQDSINFRYGKIKVQRGSGDNVINTSANEKDELKSIQNRKRHTPVDFNDSNQSKETTKWPKLHRHRDKSKSKKHVLRSTRMTPLYLMQQSGEHDHNEHENKHEHYEHKYAEKHVNKTTTVNPYLQDEVEVDSLSPYSIKQQMLEIANDFPEANITVQVIGRTIEYNDIVMLKVSERKSDISKYFRADDSKYVDEVPEKKIIFIVHGLSVMGIAKLPCLVARPSFKILLSYYLAYLDKFDIFLIPIANPDGFVMRHSLWNKNMSPQGACPGVALDRNFDVAWNSSTAISSCSQHFPGLIPFSEPETRAIREVLHHYSHKINGFFHVHSGTYNFQSFKGDAVLYPKGYTDVQTDDDKYIDLRGEIDEALKNASFQVLSVTVDTIQNWYGKVYGSSVDYASAVFGIPYAMELVMQPFEDMPSEPYSLNALKEIWKRVIDVVFNHIWRNTKNSDT